MAKVETQAKGNTAKTGRQRQLNVIYFVDSARTRSFRMPLARLNMLLAGVSFLMVWSVASVVLLGWVILDRQAIADRLSDTLATLFEYETRHDGVYDIAYPRDKSEPIPAAQRPKITEPEAVAVDTSSDTVIAQTTEQAPADEAAETADETSAEAEGGGDALVSVDNPVIEQEANEFRLSFNIKNNNTPIRVGGYVWAVAEFRQDDGTIIYLGAPESIAIDAKGVATKPKRAHSFSIRRFSRKKFEFAFPPGKSGRIANIRINVMNRDGKGLAVYDVPVDIRVVPQGGSTPSGPTDGKKSG